MPSKLAIKDIKKRAAPLFRRYGVRKAAIFGSHARGEAKKSSDIDVLVEVQPKTGLLEFVGLKQDLEEALDREVDLVTYRGINPLLRERILRDQIVIYEKRPRRLSNAHRRGIR